MGTLYVVATPIGNLEDISARAVRVLAEVSLIAAEDTRHTGKLLKHIGVKTPQISYHLFNERARIERLLQALQAGDVALVSDAGTPGISDPGVALVDAALEAGVRVVSVPGASSLTSAVSISGLIDGPFAFVGFIPRKGKERAAALSRWGAAGCGLVLFEAANRLAGTLHDLAAAMPARRFAVIRELTKIHEEVVRGVLEPTRSFAEFDAARGEIVIVIEAAAEALPTVEEAEEVVRRLVGEGLSARDAAREAASVTGRPRSELYKIAIELGSKRG